MKKNSEYSILSQEESVRSLYGSLINKSGSSIDSDGSWLITLSDILFLLLIFFIMFFVMTRDSRGFEKAQHDREQNYVLPGGGLLLESATLGKRIGDKITSEINNLDLGDEISVLATNREIIITMKEKVTFRPGETDILKSPETILDNIAEIIREYPDFFVEIGGHTDNIPIKTLQYPSNWELSVARATSVLKYFINNHAIDPSRLSIIGYADQKPVAPNDTPANRAQNRRVEIRLKEIET